MYIYASLIFIICILAYVLDKNRVSIVLQCVHGKKCKNNHRGFICIFVILAFFSAIRDGIGIDYIAYYWHIENIQKNGTNYMEHGFQYLVKLLGNFSTNPRWVIIVCSVATCYFFIKAIYDQSVDVVLSLFLFMSFGYYFLSFNTIRGYLAMSIVLYAIKFLNNKQNLRFIVFVLLACSFHKSAIVCIPLYYLAKCNFKKIHYLIMSLIPLVAFLFKNQIRLVYFMLYPTYEGSRYDSGGISWLNVIKGLLVVILGIIYYSKINEKKELMMYFNLNFFSLIFYIGFPWTPEISRIGFYMNLSMIFFVPNIIKFLDDVESRRILKYIILVSGTILFILMALGWYDSGIKLLPYKTWLTTGF